MGWVVLVDCVSVPPPPTQNLVAQPLQRRMPSFCSSNFFSLKRFGPFLQVDFDLLPFGPQCKANVCYFYANESCPFRHPPLPEQISSYVLGWADGSNQLASDLTWLGLL